MRKGKGRNNGLLPNSLRIISSCLKTVSANASNVASTVRSAGATVAASISASEDQKDQVTWAGFDRLELGPSTFKKVLLLGYQNGFQVLDVEDASNFTELASKRDGPVSFLQLQPLPQHSDDSHQKLKASHPMLLVVAGDETNTSGLVRNPVQLGPTARDVQAESHSGNSIHSPTTVRFFSLRSHCYVHVLRFRSSVCMVRCSSRVIAVGLATQIYCFDAITLENKFSVLTYPVPQLAGQGGVGISVGYGPMAVGPRWLAYASNSPFISNTGRLSPQNLSPSPGVSPSTSPGGSSLVARYARESSKQLATGLLNLGDMGYKSLSKCYQELLPDGSNSPVSPNSVWKVGRPAVTDMDNVGMVVVKDFVSRAVISQFKAHSSAISALCFDPSGTLLVTASIHGNNINIFRIMPSLKRTGSGAQNYDWSSSHVHLYQLHRGITSAMIQDICFSNFSQWVAIVSSKGTCHIFVLSPFGGDAGFQTFISHGKEPSLFPILTLPWWSTSSCVINQHSCPPPPPATLSVVSRIKYSSFGWLNTVSSASGSSTGKVFVPSGAVASVFHNSISDSLQHVNSRTNSLEHLLVFTPSGHVVQHELLPSIGVDSGDNGSRTQSASHFHSQEDDLRVKVEPVRWWDVCRRSDWAEREECISQTKFERQDASGVIPNSSGDDGTCGMKFLEINGSVGGQKASKVLSVKSQERSHWYLSNAEVQVNTGRLPIWQKSKISFYMMEPPRLDVLCGGEFEIEKVSLHEVEIRCKELLPVFDHFHGTKSGWNDRCFTEGKNPPHLEAQHGEYKVTQETITCHSKPSSLSSTESSEGGSSRRMENLLDMDQMNYEKSYSPTRQILSENCPVQNGSNFPELSFLSRETLIVKSSPFQHSENINSYAGEPIKSSLPALEYKSSAPSGGITEEAPSSDSGEFSMLSTNHFDSDNTTTEESPTVSTAQNLLDFELLREEHYQAETKCSNVNEAVNDDVESSSVHSEKEKTDEDGENDDMLGGMFAFFEED